MTDGDAMLFSRVTAFKDRRQKYFEGGEKTT